MSSTLLRNMREKDLRKAIAYHMKKSQAQYDPKQKGLPVDQTRINYLDELSELKSFGGKSFSATMMVGLGQLALQLYSPCVVLWVRCGHSLQFLYNCSTSPSSALLSSKTGSQW